MELTKTMKIRIYPVEDDMPKLRRTMKEYTAGLNFASKIQFEDLAKLQPANLCHRTYKYLRTRYGLKSQFASSIPRTVVGTYRALKAKLQKERVSVEDSDGKYAITYKDLAWLKSPVRYSRPQADMVLNRDYSFVKDLISVNTLDGRIRCKYTTSGFTGTFNDKSWKKGTAKLLCNDGKWFLHIAVSKQVPDIDSSSFKDVVGIDRGLRFLAVSYDSKGKTEFFGKGIVRTRNKYNHLREQLQQKKSRYARKRLLKIGHRETRWVSDVNHRISKALVEKHPNGLFVLEDLARTHFVTENLGKRMKNEISSWSFAELEQYLKYKAREAGGDVIEVSAAYTSQRCPKCGSVNKLNRDHMHHEYHCHQCGYRSNDDRTAAMNIQNLGTEYVSGEAKPHYSKQSIA